MARERERRHDGHGTEARGMGSALSARQRRKGGRGMGTRGLVGQLGLLDQISPLGQMAVGLEERKGKIEIYFEIGFQL
jgi:hypothetical protein